MGKYICFVLFFIQHAPPFHYYNAYRVSESNYFYLRKCIWWPQATDKQLDKQLDIAFTISKGTHLKIFNSVSQEYHVGMFVLEVEGLGTSLAWHIEDAIRSVNAADIY